MSFVKRVKDLRESRLAIDEDEIPHCHGIGYSPYEWECQNCDYRESCSEATDGTGDYPPEDTELEEAIHTRQRINNLNYSYQPIHRNSRRTYRPAVTTNYNYRQSNAPTVYRHPEKTVKAVTIFNKEEGETLMLSMLFAALKGVALTIVSWAEHHLGSLYR